MTGRRLGLAGGAALAVLLARTIPHEIVYTSASLLGVIAAVQAGLGVTVLGRSSLPAGLTTALDLPPLGHAEMAISVAALLEL